MIDTGAALDLPTRDPDEALQRIARVMLEEAALLRECWPHLAAELTNSAHHLQLVASDLRPS